MNTTPVEVAATPGLTPREMECLRGVATGVSSLTVAHSLGVRKRTVDFHLANAYDKLGVSNRVQAINKAREIGVLQ